MKRRPPVSTQTYTPFPYPTLFRPIGMSVWRAREAKNAETFGSARWADTAEVKAAGLLGADGVVLGKLDRAYLRHDGPEHVLCRSEEHTSELQSLMRISYADLGLQKKK